MTPRTGRAQHGGGTRSIPLGGPPLAHQYQTHQAYGPFPPNAAASSTTLAARTAPRFQQEALNFQGARRRRSPAPAW
uniref:Uncharacterized protein n=1 Tax=Arundo donax TaxID=35708 RepID=A0A0A9B1J1_ARUDO